MKLVPSTFRFSLSITVICLVLATVMVWAATWQWTRYKWKRDLVATYEHDSKAIPAPFPIGGIESKAYQELIDRRVTLSGTYDFEHQIITTNKKHASGPGHWLITPLHIDGTDQTILVSRGFIPFGDRTPETWGKYTFSPHETLSGILKRSISPSAFAPKNPDAAPGKDFQSLWLYEEIDRMGTQLPYKILNDVYLQRVGKPERGGFPAQAISIEVPPSTHFGYTIEWCLLAITTLVVGYILQSFPWLLKRRQRESL